MDVQWFGGYHCCQKHSWFESWQETFCVEIACSPCAIMGFLRVLLPQSKNMRIGMICDPKLPKGMSVSVCGILLICWLEI